MLELYFLIVIGVIKNKVHMKCHICQNTTSVIFETKILKKYDVSYHQCSSCRFIQTDDPFWLPEAYEKIITSLDIGLISRNLYLQEQVPNIINTCFTEAKSMLDYGGGYGMFVRMMRDIGFDFFRQDIYCDNLFSKHFDITDFQNKKIDIVTAFEVFEHLNNPLVEIEKMFKYSENVIFSTTLIPDDINLFKDWWYVAPETGQHISFYSEESLRFIAKKYNLFFYTNHSNLHFFSNELLNQNIVDDMFLKKVSLKERIYNRLLGNLKSKHLEKKSLLQSDYDYILKKISK